MQKLRDGCLRDLDPSANNIKKKEARLLELTEVIAKSRVSEETCRLQSIDLRRKLDASVSESIVLWQYIKALTKHRDGIEEDRCKLNIEKAALR